MQEIKLVELNDTERMCLIRMLTEMALEGKHKQEDIDYALRHATQQHAFQLTSSQLIDKEHIQLIRLPTSNNSGIGFPMDTLKTYIKNEMEKLAKERVEKEDTE